MPSEPTIQHWLVSVVRAAGLDPDEKLEVDSTQAPEGAWDLVGMASGLSSDELAGLVAKHYRLEVADLPGADPYSVRLLPGSVARKLHVVPLAHTSRSMSVATADPVGLGTELQLSKLVDRSVTFAVAAPEAISARLEELYPRESEAPPHEIPPLDRDAMGGPRVLVVDDDPGMRLLLRRTFEEEGFRVEEADDGRAALQAVREGDPFDLLTLDLQMQEMHGLDVLKELRSKHATSLLPVIVATASDDPEIEMQLFDAGADDFVVKPVDPPRFVLRAKAVLRRRSSDPFSALL